MYKKTFPVLFCLLSLAILSGQKNNEASGTVDPGNPYMGSMPAPSNSYRIWDHGPLQVSSNHRYLEHADGTPFLWIGDTAWELFYRVRSSDPAGNDLEGYFLDRKNKGFTVIQAVLVDELDYKTGRGCAENGSTPFVDRDPRKRVDAYWKWVDHVVDRAREHGLYMCMLPCWGNWVNEQAIFNTDNAYDYGRFLGERYRNSPNIIWMLGGDRSVDENQKAIWNSMAAGIKSKIGNNHLMTFHPAGAKSSSMDFHNEPWMDFNNHQSGHQKDGETSWRLAIEDWNKTPAKPTLNSEPGYEGIVERFWVSCDNPRFVDYDVRKDAYRSLLAGGFGHTYGHSSIWQMLRPGDTPVACADPDVNWYDAIHWPGSSQMTHVGNLLKSRPANRWRDESLVIEGMGSGKERMGASRGDDFAFIYFPASMTRTIQLDKISGRRVKCYWYNTRTGENKLIGTYRNSGTRTFTTTDNLDWLLVIDNAAAGYAPPGKTDIWYVHNGLSSGGEKEKYTVVKPAKYEKALRNPLKGFTTRGIYEHPWATTAHTYIRWNELENHESDGIEKIKAVCDEKWRGAEENNVKVIPRVYLHWSGDNKHWPADMQEDDYSSKQFQERVVRLIKRLGECWDNDPRVAFVEMGIFGKWGEHHAPSPNDEIQKLVGDAFAEAFKNKKISVRHNWKEFTEHPFGEYWDSWAHYEQMWPHGNSIRQVNNGGRYLETYIGGEVAYDWGDYEIQPGLSPTASVALEQHRNFIINSIRWLHCTQLRWIENYDQNNEEAVKGAQEIQKAFGYRYMLDEVRFSLSDSLNVEFEVINTGSAPFYYDWPVEIALLDRNSHKPVWRSTIKNADIRDWLPGEKWTDPDWTAVSGWSEYLPDWNWNAADYGKWENPPQKNTVKESFKVDLPEGTYVLSLAILDPAGNLPSLRFASANYLNGGRHPVGMVDFEKKFCSPLSASFAFDDPAKDYSLHYIY